MMPYVNPEAMTAVGSKTKQTVIYKSESHKLHQAFPVKKGEVILQGQPVQLNIDGTIQAYFGTGTGTGIGIYLGIAVTDTQYPAYPVGKKIPEVTVMVEAFAIVYGVAGVVMNTCGAVLPNKLDGDSIYVTYILDDKETSITKANPKFVNLNTAAINDLIAVMVR
jgi:hypothetical protein